MAVYPYYPAYQPYYPQQMPDIRQPATNPMPQMMQPQPQPQQQGPNFALVNSEQEARDFIVLPGNSVFLMSRNDSVFWLKTTDQSGLSGPLRTFDYTERINGGTPPAAQTTRVVEYVPRDEYDALAARVAVLEQKKTGSGKKSAAGPETEA